MAETHSNGVASPNNNAKPDLQSLKLGQDSFSNAGLSSATATSVDNFDEIIPHPEDVPHRNLVLCFDGTGDQFDSDVSPYHSYPILITDPHRLRSPEFQYRRLLFHVEER